MPNKPKIYFVTIVVLGGMPPPWGGRHLLGVVIPIDARDALRASDHDSLAGDVVPMSWKTPPLGAACEADDAALMLLEAAAEV